MPTTVPMVRLGVPDQPEVRFVNKSRGLEGVSGRLSGQMRGGEFPQLFVDEGQ